MKKLILLTFLLSILLPRELFLNTNEALSVKSSQYSQGTNIERGNDLIDNSVITREDIILFEWYLNKRSKINIPSNKVSKLLKNFKV